MKIPLRNLKFIFASLFLLFTVSVSGWGQIANHVVISEVYGGGGNSGSYYTHDFIELYNPTSSPVNLNGWSVQYAAATGTTWQKTDLSGIIPAYGFFLIQQAQGTGGTAPLPTPDVIGTTPIAAANGKVALVNNTTALSGECPTGDHIIDFAGFGTANCYEGSGATPAPSNTTSVERKAYSNSTATSMAAGGIDSDQGNGWDSNNNSTDFVQQSNVNPQNTSSPIEPKAGAPEATFNPPDEATLVLLDVNPVITFNKMIHTTAGVIIDNSNVESIISFRKNNESGDIVPFSATVENSRIITIVPDSQLENEQLYYLAVAPVQDAAGNESTTQSITFTTIADTTPLITLTYPEGGEVLYAFDFTTITWTSENITHVKVEVYVPAEENWIELAGSVPAGEGEFILQIFENAGYSTKYKIRVSDATAPEVNDVSGEFTIIGYAATIADLRNNHAEGDIVKLAGEGVITFQQTFHNQRYIQDATAAVLIDDDNAKITTAFSQGDGIVNLVGKLVYFSNYIQFVPEFDPGPGNSPALYTVVPAEISMEQFLNNFSDYESQLVTINEMLRFPSADGTATFLNGEVLDITNDELTGKFRNTFYNVDYIDEKVPDNYVIITGIINESTSIPIGKYITPRNLADFIIYNNDATLSVFTIGGENVLSLEGIVVDEPEDKGAYLEVDDFANFVGLVATAMDNNAQRTVMVNGAVINEGEFATLSFADRDEILVAVVAEDTKTTKLYKVTLWEEIPYINITEPQDGASYFVLQALHFEWETNLTGIFYLEVTFPLGNSQIIEELDAETGEFTLSIPNGILSGTYKFRLIWKENTSVASNQVTVTATDNLKPSLVMTRPANGAKNVPVDQVLRMTFDEPVFAKEGNIVVKKAEDNSVFATIDIEGTDVEFNGNEVNITLPEMVTDTEYYILADQGIVMDMNGLEFDGITDENTWRFTTVGFYEITILVTDGTNPLEDAYVTLYTDPVRNLQTNAEGKAVFEDVPFGSYGLSVVKTGYQFINMTIDADEDKTIPVTLIPDGATTYEVRFKLTHNGDPFPWARVDLEGYGNRWADENGVAVFSQVLPADDIPFTVTNWDIETYEGMVTVTDANVIVPVAVTKVYEVVFIVTDGTAPVGGALVEFDDQEVTTSESGYAIFEKVREGMAKPYTISKTGYVNFVGTADVADHWIQISVVLEKVKVTITFNISDEAGPVEGALVNFNEEQKTTGSDGKAIFTGVEYEMGIPYIISKDGYHTANGTVDGIEDTDVNVTLDLIKYTVTFTVNHGANPVSGATVTVSGQSPITTNASGVANIDLAPGAYTYSVQATGFVSVTDIGFTVIDEALSIPVNLSAVNIIDPASQQNKMLVYPNPSDGKFTLEIGKLSSQKVMVEILDITGKVVYRNDFNALGNLKETIDMQHVTKGMYFLRIMEGDKISTMKLMFR